MLEQRTRVASLAIPAVTVALSQLSACTEGKGTLADAQGDRSAATAESPSTGPGGAGGAQLGTGGWPNSDLEELQRQHVELRFGMFLHFGTRTSTGGEWGEPDQDISQFNPTHLHATQWAEAAASGHMQFGILTTKHHSMGQRQRVGVEPATHSRVRALGSATARGCASG